MSAHLQHETLVSVAGINSMIAWIFNEPTLNSFFFILPLTSARSDSETIECVSHLNALQQQSCQLQLFSQSF